MVRNIYQFYSPLLWPSPCIGYIGLCSLPNAFCAFFPENNKACFLGCRVLFYRQSLRGLFYVCPACRCIFTLTLLVCIWIQWVNVTSFRCFLKFCVGNVQEEIFSSKSVFIWWPKFHFNNKINWGWRACGEVQRGGEGDSKAGTCNPGLESLFLKWLLMTICLFYSWVCCFVSCSAITEGLAVIAVGHQKLLPTASCVSSAQAPVTVSFSYTLCFPQ